MLFYAPICEINKINGRSNKRCTIRKRGRKMKKYIIISFLILNVCVALTYVHIFSYQDFSDFAVGQVLSTMTISSNDDGTNGTNDVWGPNKEYTWPDVPGDTNIYLTTDKPLEIVDINNENVLFLNMDDNKKSIIGLKEIPDTTEHTLKIYYDFYLDTTGSENYSFVLFSTEKPDTVGRIWIVYENNVIKVYRHEKNNSKEKLFSKEINLKDKWITFAIESRFRNEFRVIINNGVLTHVNKLKRTNEIGYFYIGNWLDKNNYSSATVYLKNIVVAHRK